MTVVAGVDIAGGSWMVVYLDESGYAGLEMVERLSEWETGAAVVAVDVPLDLPGDRIGRPAEDMARSLLPGRASTVFSSLPRHLYESPYTAETRREARSRYGSAYSKQAWNLGPAIIDAAGARDDRWFETHPELAFGRIAGGPLPPKTSWAGVRSRLDALDAVDVRVPAIPGRLRTDDVLDAAVCAHVARRILEGDAERVPAGASVGGIWF